MAHKVNYKKIKMLIINGKKRGIYIKAKGRLEYIKSKGKFVLLSAYLNKNAAKIVPKKLIKSKETKKVRGGNKDNSSSSKNIIIITHPDGTKEEGCEELYGKLIEGDKIRVIRKDGTIIEAKYINTNVVVDKKLGKDGFVSVLVNTSNNNGDFPDYRGTQFSKARDHNKITTRVKNFFRKVFNKEKKGKGLIDVKLNRLLLSGKLFRTENGRIKSNEKSRSTSSRISRSTSS
jgi:hypothetical protein